MNTFDSLKAALDAWIAEDPSARRYTKLTAGDISEILSHAKTLETAGPQPVVDALDAAEEDEDAGLDLRTANTWNEAS